MTVYIFFNAAQPYKSYEGLGDRFVYDKYSGVRVRARDKWGAPSLGHYIFRIDSETKLFRAKRGWGYLSFYWIIHHDDQN